MKEILQTNQLECSNSTFLLDLVKHNSGSLYVEVAQHVHSEKAYDQSIKINPIILNDLINVLRQYHELIDNNKNLSKSIILAKDQKEIEKRYLKGVALDDLSLQFRKPKELIENVLRNRGIAIVKDTKPPRRFWKRRKR
ncbi:hypothetical protein [Owenweeksia hongkongensis]|uniref:hypothetical protein n=1 Tax=Owenweeksia hongkongensis TaxID=253245 RepID=UPI003A94F7BE